MADSPKGEKSHRSSTKRPHSGSVRSSGKDVISDGQLSPKRETREKGLSKPPSEKPAKDKSDKPEKSTKPSSETKQGSDRPSKGDTKAKLTRIPTDKIRDGQDSDMVKKDKGSARGLGHRSHTHTDKNRPESVRRKSINPDDVDNAPVSPRRAEANPPEDTVPPVNLHHAKHRRPLPSFVASSEKEGSMERLKTLFKKSDTDNSGTLEADELGALLKETFKQDDNYDDSDLFIDYAREKIAQYAGKGGGITFDQFVILYQQILVDPEIPEEIKSEAKRRDEQKAIKESKKRREIEGKGQGIVFMYESSPEVLALEQKIKTVDQSIFNLKELLKQRDRELRLIEEKKQIRNERLLQLFKSADADGNGTLDGDELTALLVRSFNLPSADSIGSYAKHQISHVSKNEVVTFRQFAVVYEKILEDPDIPPELKAGAERAEKTLRETREQQLKHAEVLAKATAPHHVVEASKPHVQIGDFSQLKNPSLHSKENKVGRDKTALEILTTEQTYIAGLKVLLKEYYFPLLEQARASDKMEETEIVTLFGPIERLYRVGKLFLRQLEERFYVWEEAGQDHIGDLFRDWGGSQELIESYCKFSGVYGEATDVLKERRATNKVWRAFFEQRDEKVKSQTKLTFRDYFVTPIQRVPRYCLLIRDLLKATPSDHSDTRELAEAEVVIGELALRVNEFIRKAESDVHIKQLNERGGGFENLSKFPEPHNGERSWMSESSVAYLHNVSSGISSKKGIKAELIMFSDILVGSLFVNKKVVPQDYHIPLALLWIHDKDEYYNKTIQEADIKEEIPFSLVFQGPESSWVVGFTTAGDKATWVRSLTAHLPRDDGEISERRKATYEFKSKAAYAGEWKSGKMHGYGSYTSPNLTKFYGTWHSVYKCGFGSIETASVSKLRPNDTKMITSGWIEKDGDIQAWDQFSFWNYLDLTQDDWDLLAMHERQVFKNGEVIIKKGNESKNMYAVVGGAAAYGKDRLIKPDPSDYVASVIFPLLGPAPFALTAVGETTLSVCGCGHIHALLSADPGFSMRFYRTMALRLRAQLLVLQGTPVDSHDEDEEVDDSELSTSENTGGSVKRSLTKAGLDPVHQIQSVHQRLGVDSSEALITTINDCFYKNAGSKIPGKLFIFKETVCFEYNSFGNRTVILLPLEKIQEVSYKKDVLDFKAKKERYSFLSVKDCDQVAKTVQTQLTEQKKLAKQGVNVKKTKIGVLNTVSTNTLLGRGETIRMGPNDWEVVLEGKSVKTFDDGEIILKEGSKVDSIYQVSSGRVRISKKTAEGEVTLAHMSEGMLFGEMSFLEPKNSNATASITADGQGVSVTMIPTSFLHLTYVYQPDIAGKFYSYLCQTITTRIGERMRDIDKSKKEKKSRHPAKKDNK